VRHSLATYIPRFVDGRVHGMFVHVADVGPLKQLEAELRAAKEDAEAMATHDFLTGLPNRALLNERVQQAIAQAKRRNEVLALLHVDVDNFKAVNDNFGHGEGDRYLIDMARRLSRAVREGDTVLRIGGDEFTIVASNVHSGEEAVEPRRGSLRPHASLTRSAASPYHRR
jgi:diguanylate cyclase (GGDEF) domain